MNRTLTGCLAERAEPLEVAGLPGGDALADAFVLAVEMLGPAGETRRHVVPMALVHALRHIAEDSLVVGLQRHVFIGLDDPGGRFALRHAEVVVARHQAPRQAAEEDAQLEIGHVRRLRNEPVLIAFAVQHQEVVLPAEGDAGLVQQAVVQADILPLRLGGDLHHFERGERDVIGLGEGHHIGDQHRRGAGKAADRQRAFDRPADAFFQLEALLQRIFGAAGIVAPVALLDKRRHGDVEFDMTAEGLAVEDDRAVLPDVELEVHALVDGEPRHDASLVVNMRAQRAHAVRTENVVLHKISRLRSK